MRISFTAPHRKQNQTVVSNTYVHVGVLYKSTDQGETSGRASVHAGLRGVR